MKLLEILVRELPKRGGWPASLYNYSLLQVSGGGIYQSGGGVELFVAELADDWNQTEITREQYESALAASKPEWNGEGLPPVGKKFEFNASAGWMQAVMKYCGESFAIIVLNGSETWLKLDGVKFRPIRSEADKKREKGVVALATADPDAVPFTYGEKMSNGGLIGSVWYDLYDAIAAGKVPGIRID